LFSGLEINIVDNERFTTGLKKNQPFLQKSNAGKVVVYWQYCKIKFCPVPISTNCCKLHGLADDIFGGRQK
jgi:hypothetical protein